MLWEETVDTGDKGKLGRAGLNVASGLIPFLGGFLAAAAAAWSEKEQEHE